MTIRTLATALSVAVLAVPAFPADPIPWRTDYNAARKEAQEKNLPLIVDVQTEQCVYCRKMEASTFLDPGFVALVNGNFIPLKIDGNKDRELAVALRVQMYPTLVLAGPDGKIHAFLQGFLTADQCRDHLKRTALAVATPDWIQRDLEHAGKAVAAAEYTKAVGLLRAIVSDGKSPPGVEKAKQVLEEIEGMAAQAFAAARAEERTGDRAKATNAVVDVSKRFAGTKAAERATTHLASLAGQRDAVASATVLSARDLLAGARDEFRTNRFAECLDLCDRLAADHPRTDEARDALALADQIKGDPDRLLTVVERQNERTATLYLTLAETWTKKGQLAEASACLEKVVALTPGSSHAAAAKTRLANLPVKPGTVPAGFKKP
jgi:thioredoxin-like negative regulator of GroEL